MKITFFKTSALMILLFIFGCKNYDEEISSINSKLDLIANEIEVSERDRFLNFIKDQNIKKTYNTEFEEFFDKKKIYFTLNLTNDKPQVIHLSSDQDKIPFMVLCRVFGDAKDDSFTLRSIQLAIRSIGKDPHTFFKIKGKPSFKEYRVDDYDWILEADIDLNTGASSLEDGQLDFTKAQNPPVIMSKQLIEVEINPEKLIASLDAIYNSNPDVQKLYNKENLDEFVRMFCCGGVICNTQPTVPKP